MLLSWSKTQNKLPIIWWFTSFFFNVSSKEKIFNNKKITTTNIFEWFLGYCCCYTHYICYMEKLLMKLKKISIVNSLFLRNTCTPKVLKFRKKSTNKIYVFLLFTQVNEKCLHKIPWQYTKYLIILCIHIYFLLPNTLLFMLIEIKNET